MKRIDEFTDEELEQFVKDNKDKFDKFYPEPNHEQHFLVKLVNKFKKIISIVPYLVKLFIVAVIIFAASIWVWNTYIRKDRCQITFKDKMIEIVIIKK